MEKYTKDASVLFMMMYEDFKKESTERGGGSYPPTLNVLMDNIEQEGFINNDYDPRFLYELYNTILYQYAYYGMGDFELGQMWKVFSKLDENGVQPIDLQAQELYLKLAREVVSNSNHCDHIDTVNKTKFLIASLESFDSSRYFFRALNKVKNNIEISAFYAYYASFIKTIAEVCPYEQLTYVILAEQLQRKDYPAGGWNHKAAWLAECGQDLRKKLHYHNHFTFSEWQEHQLFEKPIEDLIEWHIGSIGDSSLESESAKLSKYPTLIKKPSKRIYVPAPSSYYTDSD